MRTLKAATCRLSTTTWCSRVQLDSSAINFYLSSRLNQLYWASLSTPKPMSRPSLQLQRLLLAGRNLNISIQSLRMMCRGKTTHSVQCWSTNVSTLILMMIARTQALLKVSLRSSSRIESWGSADREISHSNHPSTLLEAVKTKRDRTWSLLISLLPLIFITTAITSNKSPWRQTSLNTISFCMIRMFNLY